MGLFAKKEALEKLEDKPDGIVTDLEFLRQPSRLTDLKEIEELKFVDRCKACLKTAWTAGFGLAGVQIGIPIQAAWYAMKINGVTHERLLWNPKIIKQEWPFDTKEGCLSIPDQYFMTTRYQHIEVLNGDGNLIVVNGLEAVIIQHEIAHVSGLLCTDFLAKPKPKAERNDACPECAIRGKQIKYKKCAEHFRG